MENITLNIHLTLAPIMTNFQVMYWATLFSSMNVWLLYIHYSKVVFLRAVISYDYIEKKSLKNLCSPSTLPKRKLENCDQFFFCRTRSLFLFMFACPDVITEMLLKQKLEENRSWECKVENKVAENAQLA